MAFALDEHHLNVGLDSDTHDNLIADGRNRLGFHGRSGTSEGHNVGSAESILGNILRQSVPGTNNEVEVGTCPDVKNNAIISFVYNGTSPLSITYGSASVTTTSPLVVTITTPSSAIPIGAYLLIIQSGPNPFYGVVSSIVGNAYTLTLLRGTPTGAAITSVTRFYPNYIKRYFTISQTAEYLTNPAFMSSVLGWTATTRIYNPRIVEAGYAQLLTWTDDVRPCVMDVDRMKSGGEYYLVAADEQYISLAKTVPLRPAIAYADDSTTNTNFVKNTFYQFRVRFIYDNFQAGCVSVISDISIPNPFLTKNNRIDVTFNSGHKTVRKIQLLRRIGNGVSDIGDINPEWYIYQTLDKSMQGYSDNTDYTFPFYGNEGVLPVAKEITDKIQEVVPYLADHIEVTDTNEIILVAITEGNNNVAMNATAEFLYRFNGSYQYGSGFGAAMQFNQYVAGGEPQVGDTMYGSYINPPGLETYFSYTLVLADITNNLTMATRFSAFLTSVGIANTVSLVGSNYLVESVDPSDQYQLYSVRTRLQRTFKYGVRRDVSIVYYDVKGRCTGAQIISRNLYAKTPGDLSSNWDVNPQGGGTDIKTLPYLKVTINNLPPAFSTYYQILISDSEEGDFMQFFNITASASFCIIPYPDQWDFTEGDRVKVLQCSANTAIEGQSFKIEDYNASTGVIKLEENSLYGHTGYSRFEIYHPNLTRRQFFYEFSGVRNLTGGFHQGNIQNQTGIQPAIVEIYDGDVYEKAPGVVAGGPGPFNQPFRHQTQHIASNTELIGQSYPDIYSPYWGKGRPIVETPNQRRQKIGYMGRHGESLSPNTEVNNLSVWNSGDYFFVQARHGSITGIRQRGYTLDILQWTNINKMFIGRVETTNADGSTQLLVTDKLFGTINPSEQEYGTKYPGSVVMADGILYFLDATKGEYCADVGNGVSPISKANDANMMRYWLDRAAMVKSSAYWEVISGFDNKYKDLYVTMRNLDPALEAGPISYTIYYNARDKKWKWNMEFETDPAQVTNKIIQLYGGVGDVFVSWMEGSLWQHNAGTDYCKFYGVNKKFTVDHVCNVQEKSVKVFNYHNVKGNKKPDLTIFRVPANAQLPNGMYTELYAGNYALKEGLFYSGIKGDAYTRGIPATLADKKENIVNGRSMRGQAMTVHMEFDTRELVVITSSGIGVTVSPLS